MSWDIFVHDFPESLVSVSDIPNDFQPPSIGSRSEVAAKLLEVFPDADFSDPAWGVIDVDDYSIEVSIGNDELCIGFALHVRGGDRAVGAVAAILDHLRLRAIDTQTGEFFVAGEKAQESFGKWREYRDSVVDSGS